MNNQVEQAKLLQRLHTTGTPLLLPNAWDVGSARAIEASSARAIATSSWAVSNASGYEDGEKMPLDLVLDNIRKIKNAVKCPVTLDIESGYALTPEGVKETIKKILAVGVVGINLEDQRFHEESPSLYSIEEQSKRIAYARQAADKQSVPLFINARTDVFFQPSNNAKEKKLDEVIARAHAYAKSGANGIFVPGVTDKTTARLLCKRSPLPVNLMATIQDKALIDCYSAMGVSRISFGPIPYVHAMSALTDFSKGLLGV